MGVTKIYMVRHGQTAWNADGRFMGQLDIPLDKTGLAQAARVAERLRSLRPQAIYASDLQRAWQTAEAIQREIALDAVTKPAPQITPEPRLREMAFGEWQGLTYTEIQENYPEQVKAWMTDLEGFHPPGGESLVEMTGRLKSALEDILTRHADQTVLLVAHGGSLQTLITLVTGLEASQMWQFPLKNSSISVIELYSSGWLVTLLNDTCHLDGMGGEKSPWES